MFRNIGLAFGGIWSHKLRSFLTMLGIIIGIASIITIVSTIKGTNEQIKNNLIGAGTNVVQVTLCAADSGETYYMDWNPIPEGVSVITEETMKNIRTLDGVQDASAYLRRDYCEGVYYGNNPFNGMMYGVDSHYFNVNNYKLNEGRLFVDADYKDFRKVAVVEQQLVNGLFEGKDPVGTIIEIKGEPFTVVGVVTEKRVYEPVINNLHDYYTYIGDSSGCIFVPSSCWDIIYQYDEPQRVAVRAKSTDEMTTAGKNVADALTASQVSNTKFSYKAGDLLEQASELQSLTQSANSQLIWIAGISLLVGGIGVMNIMLVSVTERTSEIGLKIAVGARAHKISSQFLTEAAVLTLLGGVFGVGAGIGLAYLLSKVMGTPVSISIPACVIAVAFSTVIGVIFGFFPAVKASRMNPIDALRHE